MTGYYRDTKSSPCASRRGNSTVPFTPQSPLWDQAETRPDCNNGFAQLILLLYPASLSTESSSSINHLHKNPQLRLCSQEAQSKSYVSHQPAQTVLRINSSHTCPMTPGSSSWPYMAPFPSCQVQKLRPCPRFFSSSHAPDPVHQRILLSSPLRNILNLSPSCTTGGASVQVSTSPFFPKCK